jgi:hypothetical protein
LEATVSDPVVAEPVPAVPKRRRGLAIGLVAASLVLLAGGVTGAFMVIRAHILSPVPGLSMPDRIGSLVKPADQSIMDMREGFLNQGGIDPVFAVVYDDSASPGRDVEVTGGRRMGEYAPMDARLLFDTFFRGPFDVEAQQVDPGRVGGALVCAQRSDSAGVETLCAWVGKDTFLLFYLSRTGIDRGTSRTREVLQAVVTS